MKILVVDDNEANRFLAKSLLERQSNIVLTASNGLVAISQCKTIVFDLILMDILMPVMDGVKALRRLKRSQGLNAQTPVFALTGYSTASDQRNYRQAGFDFVLSKPLSLKKFKRAWESYRNNIPYLERSPSIKPQDTLSDGNLLDPEIWDQLTSGACVEDLQRVIKRFWKHAHLSLNTINTNRVSASHSSRNSLSNLRKTAHGIKGASASLALLRMANIAAELQNAPPENIISLINDLHDCMKHSQSRHNDELNKLKIKRDFSEVHSDDANGPTKPIQIRS